MEEILAKLETIEKYTLLAAKQMLNVDEVALLTGLSKSTIYRLTSSGQIPYYKPNGSMCYFNRSEIESWLQRNRQATVDEVNIDATTYCVTHK